MSTFLQGHAKNWCFVRILCACAELSSFFSDFEFGCTDPYFISRIRISWKYGSVFQEIRTDPYFQNLFELSGARPCSSNQHSATRHARKTADQPLAAGRAVCAVLPWLASDWAWLGHRKLGTGCLCSAHRRTHTCCQGPGLCGID